MYTLALQEDGEDAVLFSNRAAARLKLGQAEEAAADARAALRLRPGWDKAAFRLGCALELLNRLEEALRVFTDALKANPGSRELSDRVRDLCKSLKRVQERAAGREGQGGAGGAAGRAGFGPVRAGPAGPGAPDDWAGPGTPDDWAEGLSADQRYEWLVDCYRMRVDDEYVWRGGQRGLYLMRGKAEVVRDFLVFCKLAVAHGVVPGQGWSWESFLSVAAKELGFAFEKSDAKKKWGGENVFEAFLGGRSLRATAQVVFGSGAMYGDRRSKAEARMVGKAKEHAQSLFGGPVCPSSAAFFEDVGGLDAWRRLTTALHVDGPVY